MDKLVTIATFDNIVLANIMVAKLQDSGIEDALADDNIISSQPFYNYAVGGVRLQVMDTDVEKAILIINDKT